MSKPPQPPQPPRPSKPNRAIKVLLALTIVVLLSVSAIATATGGMFDAGDAIVSVLSPDVPEMDATALKAALDRDRDDILLVDVRNPDEYAEGHIDGALLVPLPAIAKGDGIETIREALGDRQLVAYCKLGVRGAKAIALLDEAGISGKNLIGGIDTWNEAIEPSRSRD